MTSARSQGQTARPQLRMPATHQPLPAPVVDALKFGDRVTVLECETGLLYEGKVTSNKPGRARVEFDVTFGNKHIEAFYVDSDDFEDRGPTMTAAFDFMLVCRKGEHEATNDADLLGTLAASLPFQRLAARMIRAETALSQTNNALQAEIAKRELLLAEVAVLREQVEAMRSLIKPRAA